jgi:uncharacterized membrane protein HdeD (DUF308 family)
MLFMLVLQLIIISFSVLGIYRLFQLYTTTKDKNWLYIIIFPIVTIITTLLQIKF